MLSPQNDLDWKTKAKIRLSSSPKHEIQTPNLSAQNVLLVTTTSTTYRTTRTTNCHHPSSSFCQVKMNTSSHHITSYPTILHNLPPNNRLNPKLARPPTLQHPPRRARVLFARRDRLAHVSDRVGAAHIARVGRQHSGRATSRSNRRQRSSLLRRARRVAERRREVRL